MTTPAPPLTEAELDEIAEYVIVRTDFHDTATERVRVLLRAAKRALTLESELAQLRSGLYSDSLTDAQVTELQRDIELDVGAWDAVGLRQALLRELQRMRGAMPGLIRRSNELPGLSAAHDEAQHELAQLREAIETHFGGWFDAGDGYESVLATVAKELAQLRQVAAEIAEARRVDGERIGAAETELLLARAELERLRREKAERGGLDLNREPTSRARGFVAVLYLRGGALVPSVARLTQLGWVTPQAIAVDALYWAPLPPIPERP